MNSSSRISWPASHQISSSASSPRGTTPGSQPVPAYSASAGIWAAARLYITSACGSGGSDLGQPCKSLRFRLPLVPEAPGALHGVFPPLLALVLRKKPVHCFSVGRWIRMLPAPQPVHLVPSGGGVRVLCSGRAAAGPEPPGAGSTCLDQQQVHVPGGKARAVG